MSYSVKTIFGPTILGEGSLTGRVGWFVRFAGCNMWDGRPETKEESACPFCDTDFFGGEQMSALDICAKLDELGAARGSWITLSGGEPLLQVDETLFKALHSEGWNVAVETNGTRALKDRDQRPLIFDLVVCSPKLPPDELTIRADEIDDLKLLWPHPNPKLTPAAIEAWISRNEWAFGKLGYRSQGPTIRNRWPTLFLQPINDVEAVAPQTLASAVEEVYRLTSDSEWEWRLSAQLHKYLGVP